jgi:hypothetical protein
MTRNQLHTEGMEASSITLMATLHRAVGFNKSSYLLEHSMVLFLLNAACLADS